MRIVCWIIKGTDTHSEYVIVIVFPLQRLLRKRARVLRTHILPILFTFGCEVLSWFVDVSETSAA